MKSFRRNPSDTLRLLLVAVVAGVAAALVAVAFTHEAPSISESQAAATPLFQPAALNEAGQPLPDFREASRKALPAVVHIRSKGSTSSSSNDYNFDFFRMPPSGQREASGSGVILTPDGYVATNNHVVEDADKVTVTLDNNRTYDAEVIGTDPSTDLALLKIEPANELPFLPFGNSDILEVGEWVLAVGNPFNLTSTVTAGIVSAKARSIGVVNDRYRIESFIQTDAAINPGNSGGALINTRGELIGINTAIASRTGTYNGYGFAVPVSIVRKVVDDIKEFGQVQRALLGVSIRDIDQTLAEDEDLSVVQGVYVAEVNDGSAADEAKLMRGDIILRVNNVIVNSASELQEQIGLRRPGDIVKLLILRKGSEQSLEVKLKSRAGNFELVTREAGSASVSALGAVLVPLDDELAEELDLKQEAVQVQSLEPGKLKDAGVREGFIITHMDKQKVTSVEQIEQILKRAENGILISGLYPDGSKAYYAFGF